MNMSEPLAREDASDSTRVDAPDHVVENSKASGLHSASADREEPDEPEEHPPSSPTPSLNLEAAVPASGDKDCEAPPGKANNWPYFNPRRIKKSWPTTFRIARRIYRFFRGPSPPMPLPRTPLVAI
jgi:hypothetical protein